MAKRKSKVIMKPADIDYIISLQEKDFTMSTIMEMFGEFDGVSKFHPYDIITIPKGSYGKKDKKNKNSFTTTVGVYLFNKYFIEPDLFDVFPGGYINNTIDDGTFGGINKTLSQALLEDRITVAVFNKYLKKTQQFMPFVNILSPGYSEKMLTCTKVINKKKEELLKKHKAELEAGNGKVAQDIEKELLDFAKEYLKDDPSMDIFLSGARGSIGNNFKNMFVMKGAIKDPDPNAEKKYNIATSNYMDGIKADEYALFANSLSAGPYARANKTQIGGYLEKLFLYSYEDVVLGEPDSDCGTKRTITVTLDKKAIDGYMYSYIVEGQKLIELTSENVSKYLGKTVKMRFSSLCESKDCICNKCAGNMEYRRGERNTGMALTKIPSTMKNISMKSFHDSVETMNEMNICRAFGVE